jgi:sugar (pentulose or hexulose) kinase
MKSAFAVFDIGMTNKKVVIYDEALRQADAVYRVFPAIPARGLTEKGELEAHDLAGIEDWFLGALASFASRYPIRAIAVTTHGATLVCVGEDGLPCAPCVFYTHEPGDDFHERFYRLVGEPKKLQAVTGTPAFKAMINPSKGLMFVREQFPEEFARTRLVLNYPQYWGYRLTGKAGAEATYVGCHTYLWDFTAGRPSEVARRLGVEKMLPAGLHESWDVLGAIKPEVASRTGLGKDVIVTMGIHDSNASLLPYLAKQGGRDFVLDSTGTWCVVMHPQEKYGFSADELGKVVFFNQSALRKPVKTAIFTGGLEFDDWTALIDAASGAADDTGSVGAIGAVGAGRRIPPFDPAVYRDVIRDRELFILPEIVQGSGQFPESKARAIERGREFTYESMKDGGPRPAFFADRARAYAALNLSLAIQTDVALGRAGLAPGADVFVEGGFRKNEDYVALVQALVPRSRLALTNIAEATSFGAAMTAKAALTGARLHELAGDFEIERSDAPRIGLPGLDEYRIAFLRLAENDRR